MKPRLPRNCRVAAKVPLFREVKNFCIGKHGHPETCPIQQFDAVWILKQTLAPTKRRSVLMLKRRY